MNDESLNIAIIALNRLNSFGKKKTRRLLDCIENKDELTFFQAIRQGIKMGIFQKKQAIGQFLDAEDYAQKVIQTCKQDEIQIVNCYSENFPKTLIFDNGPQLLYYKGDLSCLDEKKRATVIGTRHPNEAGKNFSYNIGKLLAENGFVIISGLAQGSDSLAHRAALDNGAKTVAFVPSNLKQIAPHSNTDLAQEIVEKGGLVISEYSPLSTPNSNMYITRDRLQAACPLAVFVSEFDSNSGTLQTLEFASKFKKPIYTLDTLLEDPEFNGYQSLIANNIKCHILNWEEIEKTIPLLTEEKL